MSERDQAASLASVPTVGDEVCTTCGFKVRVCQTHTSCPGPRKPPCRYCGHDLSTHNGPYCMQPPTPTGRQGASDA